MFHKKLVFPEAETFGHFYKTFLTLQDVPDPSMHYHFVVSGMFAEYADLFPVFRHKFEQVILLMR